MCESEKEMEKASEAAVIAAHQHSLALLDSSMEILFLIETATLNRFHFVFLQGIKTTRRETFSRFLHQRREREGERDLPPLRLMIHTPAPSQLLSQSRFAASSVLGSRCLPLHESVCWCVGQLLRWNVNSGRESRFPCLLLHLSPRVPLLPLETTDTRPTGSLGKREK